MRSGLEAKSKSNVFAGTAEELDALLTAKSSSIGWDPKKKRALFATELGSNAYIALNAKLNISPEQFRSATLYKSGKGFRVRATIDQDTYDKFVVISHHCKTIKEQDEEANDYPPYCCHGIQVSDDGESQYLDVSVFVTKPINSVPESYLGEATYTIAVSFEYYNDYSTKAIVRSLYDEEKVNAVTYKGKKLVSANSASADVAAKVEETVVEVQETDSDTDTEE
jgi:hypothetical protein